MFWFAGKETSIKIVLAVRKTAVSLVCFMCLFSTVTVTVRAQSAYTVSGHITLSGCVNPAQSISFDFASLTSPVFFSQTVTLAPDGSFSFSNIPADMYTVGIKGAKWLRQNTSLDVTAGDVSSVSVTLPAGDADNNNIVNIGDFGLFVNAFGSSINDPTSGYDSRPDFNCDGLVDLGDFGLFVNSYGSVGDEYAANLVAQISDTSVTLTWQGSPTASRYNIYRSTSSSNYSTPTYTVSGNTHTYFDNVNLPKSALFYIVKAVNADGVESPRSNEVVAIGRALYSINCGGSAAGTFAADAYFTGGTAISTSSTPDTTTFSDPAPSTVYQTARADTTGFIYTFPNLTPEMQYLVRLHLLDAVSTEPLQRQFNISINGTVIEPNFDIFGWVGNTNQVVVAEYMTTPAPDGNIQISFTATIGQAICSGIDIQTAELTPPGNVESYATGDSKVTLYWDKMPGATGYNIYRGTAENGENLSVPINGATPVNTPSYVGSNTIMYTDTNGVINGTDYYYTVKAIYPNGGSTASSESVTTASVSGIPWDSRDTGTILSSVYATIVDDLSDSDLLDGLVALGPDGTIYDNASGATTDFVQFDGNTNEFQTTDGDLIRFAAMPNAPPDALIVRDTNSMPGANGPQRRIATDIGFQAIRGDFTLTNPELHDKIYTNNMNLSNQNPQMYIYSSDDNKNGKHTSDTAEVHLGSHLAFFRETKQTVYEAEGALSFGPLGWGVYLNVEGKITSDELRGKKDARQPRKRAALNRQFRFDTGEHINLTFHSRYPINPNLCAIEAFNASDLNTGPHLVDIKADSIADLYPILTDPQAKKLAANYEGKTVWSFGGGKVYLVDAKGQAKMGVIPTQMEHPIVFVTFTVFIRLRKLREPRRG